MFPPKNGEPLLSTPEATANQRLIAPVDLSQAVTNRGFTPALRQLPALLQLLCGEEDLASATALAIRRMGAGVLPALLLALPESQRPLRGRLTDLIGRFATSKATGEPSAAQALLLQLVGDADLKTQLNAVAALGRQSQAWSEQALLAALNKEPRRELQLALMRALGKVGGKASQAALAVPLVADDVAAQRVRGRAQLILQREQSRTQATEIAVAEPLGRPRPLWLSCRDGLEQLLAQEANERGYDQVEVMAPGRVQVWSARPLADLWRLRLMTYAGLPLTPTLGGSVEAAVASSLQQAEPLLQHLTQCSPSDASGTLCARVRYRICWPEASKAQLWSMAAKLMATCPNLVNDPTLSTWDLRIHAAPGTTQVELRPKRWVDPRFAYRLGFVPAASHPTIAAALARVAAVRPEDIVWDPFTGSGSELIECAFSGPVQALYGTDLDPEAIAVARGNAEAAKLGSRISLTASDFSAFSGPRPTLIITNPPMGRRVQRGQLAEVLERFAEVAGALLAPGGRLVWLAPLPMRTNPIFERLGLRPLLQQTVDMGGFPAKLQHLAKLP